MATDILDKQRFKNQCSLYESTRLPLENDAINRSNSTAMSKINQNHRKKYATQTPTTSNNSHRQHHSESTDILSLIRSFAFKPFKTSSMANTFTGGQAHHPVLSDSQMSTAKSSVNLLKIRPLSDVVTDHASYTQSTYAVEEFLKRMGWTGNASSDEGRVQWNRAMKYLIPSKFDVNRALDLYRIHENLRKSENLDRIWIRNPELIREIQSGNLFSLPQLPNQPMTMIFTVSNVNSLIPNDSFTQHERELITLQSLICQLDVVTESLDVQQNGLNFIYDMQNCSTSQFDINLSKKILKFFQGGYPALLKNIFIISPPKWFRVIYKVTLFSPEQIHDYLTTQSGYSTATIPYSLGGAYDPSENGQTRYEMCLSKVTNPQSICHSYYILENMLLNTKSSMNKNLSSIAPSTNTAMPSSPSSFLSFFSKRLQQSPQRKRHPPSAVDCDKRRRSNESLIEEDDYSNQQTLPKENLDEKSKRNETSYRTFTGQQEDNDYQSKSTMKNNEIKQSKALNEQDFLARTHLEIRQEFRQLPNPPAKDIHAARDERNLDKNRYRDVIPGESTRVKLQPDEEDKHEYINANYVSGYNKHEKAYIFTQGPLQHTVKDFWRMIWQENISIIVMTTNIRESGTMKCFSYWPLNVNEQLHAGQYHIENQQIDQYESFLLTTLVLKKTNHSDSRRIYHAHYLKWPDHGVPTGTKDALLFLEKVEYYKQLTQTNAPILLHCSAGIGRTGTFCAIDIGIKQYLNEKIIDIPTNVIQMRHERAGSVQTEDQYLFVYLALMDFIKQHQIIQERIHNLEITNRKQRILTSSQSSTTSLHDSINEISTKIS